MWLEANWIDVKKSVDRWQTSRSAKKESQMYAQEKESII